MMSRISVSETGDYFVKDGKPFFLLSDTDWMAFQRLNLEEWEELVRYRKAQGFNALQISVLPISHDNSAGPDDTEPFAKNGNGYDFSQINDGYFSKAEKMLEVMRRYDLIPFLHLFWVNYIPDTWGAKASPGTVIPEERLEEIARFVVNRFRRFEPIYSVSGDTNFPGERAIRYYSKVLDILRELDPQGLTTLHLQPTADPPEEICSHPQMHFYSYQSGHSVGIIDPEGWQHPDQTAMLDFNLQFLGKPHKKPIVNTEPCYEGHGYGFQYGRFSAYDVRRACWLSLISGGKAGITYGAHGIWQFQKHGMRFNNTRFSGMPYEWRTALCFPGAWDYAFARWLYGQYRMHRLSPCDLVRSPGRLAPCAAAPDKDLIVLYAPYNFDIVLKADLAGYEILCFDLENRVPLQASVQIGGETTIVQMNQVNQDFLIIALK